MRRFKTAEEIAQEQRAARAARTIYQTHKLLLIYARQSTKKQVVNNKESAKQQTVKLLELALEAGWEEKDTTIFIENMYNKYGELTEELRNASGNLSIDERAGLTIVVQMIKQGLVGAIMVWAVDRLTRDEDEIDGPVFVKLCKEYGVLILTPDYDFDFNNPKRDDRQRFLDLAREAANYTKSHVKKRMLPARNEKAMRGEYWGHNVPSGFMLDDAREHYLENPLWSPTIAGIFKRFRELDANIAVLHREICGKAIFKELPEDIKERVGPIYLTPVVGGYTIKSRSGLMGILTNVAYIGHAAYDGRIVKRNAHKAIVDEDDFFFAYNALAETDLEGNPIAREKRVVRYHQTTTEKQRQGLLEGTRANGRAVISATGKQRSVHFYQKLDQSTGAVYAIIDTTMIAESYARASINASKLDAIVIDCVLHRMRPTFLGPNIPLVENELYQQFKAVQQHIETPLSTVQDTIAETRGKIARLDREYNITFDIMSDQEVRDNREQKARLVKKLGQLEHRQTHEQELEQDMHDVAKLLAQGPLHEQWAKMPFAKQQKLIRLTTQQITLDELGDGWLKLAIVWSPYLGLNFIDTAYIWQDKAGKFWNDEEKAFLREYYPTASRQWLLEHLPTRTWEGIKTQASKMGVSRWFQYSDSALPIYLSVEDKRIMDEHELVMEGPDKRVWWKKVSLLNNDGAC